MFRNLFTEVLRTLEICRMFFQKESFPQDKLLLEKLNIISTKLPEFFRLEWGKDPAQSAKKWKKNKNFLKKNNRPQSFPIGGLKLFRQPCRKKLEQSKKSSKPKKNIFKTKTNISHNFPLYTSKAVALSTNWTNISSDTPNSFRSNSENI